MLFVLLVMFKNVDRHQFIYFVNMVVLICGVILNKPAFLVAYVNVDGWS